VGIPVPAEFQSAADIALNSQLRQVFERPELDADSIQALLKEATNSKVSLDVTTLEYVIRKKLEKEADNFATDSGNFEEAQRLRKLLEFIASLPFPVVLREAQNVAYGPLIKDMEEHRREAEKGNPIDQNWMNELSVLREILRIQNA
jgi:ATP-dependent Lon protease